MYKNVFGAALAAAVILTTGSAFAESASTSVVATSGISSVVPLPNPPQRVVPLPNPPKRVVPLPNPPKRVVPLPNPPQR